MVQESGKPKVIQRLFQVGRLARERRDANGWDPRFSGSSLRGCFVVATPSIRQFPWRGFQAATGNEPSQNKNISCSGITDGPDGNISNHGLLALPVPLHHFLLNTCEITSASFCGRHIRSFCRSFAMRLRILQTLKIAKSSLAIWLTSSHAQAVKLSGLTELTQGLKPSSEVEVYSRGFFDR